MPLIAPASAVPAPPPTVDPEMLRAKARQAGRFLRLLGNSTRLMVLCQLVDGEKTVGELCGLLGAGQSGVSQHLSRLRRDGLVAARRDSRNVYYAVASADALRILETLYAIYCQPQPAAEAGAAAAPHPRPPAAAP